MKKKPARKATKKHARKPTKTAKKSKIKKTARARSKAKKMKAKPRTIPRNKDNVVITMVVDESGSMASLFEATVAGFNEYVAKTMRDLKHETVYFSAITFDTRGIRKLQTGAALKDAIQLNSGNYAPTGGTPLLDAVGQAIVATDSVMVTNAGTKAIVVIQTDGQENASEQYKLADIKTMIEERQAKDWQFVFIGAGINAFDDASRMGIHAMNTMSYTPDAVGTRATFNAMASNTRGYAAGAVNTMNFSVGQSVAAGEDAAIISAKLQAAAPPHSNSEKRRHAAMNQPVKP